MIVQLSPDAPPGVTDVGRLDRLHAECSGALAGAQLGELCSEGPDPDHVWLDVAGLRSAGLAAAGDPEFEPRFDAMIAYAGSKGWLDATGTRVRAHVEPG